MESSQVKKYRKLGMIVLGIGLLSQLVSTPALAEERSFAISPPIAELDLVLGKTQETTITISNLTDSLVSLEAFVRDFVADSSGDEPRILGETETSSYSLKSWLLVSDKQFTLGPNEAKTITVTVAVPKGVEPGGRYGLVGFSEPNTPIGQGVAVKAGIASLLFATVAGDIKESAIIDQFRGPVLDLSGRPDFNLAIANTGNVHITPAGSIRVTNLLGRQVATLPVNDTKHMILPDSSRSFTETWRAGSAFGLYHAQASVLVSKAGDTIVSPVIAVWVFPIRLVATVLLSLVILILLAYEVEHIRANRRLAARENT